MKKTTALAKAMLLLLLPGVLLIACSKKVNENVPVTPQEKAASVAQAKKRAFKMHSDTWYRIVPIAPLPLTVHGVSTFGFAYVPGGGIGNATHMGHIQVFFNRLLTAATRNYKSPKGRYPLQSPTFQDIS